MSMSSTVCLGAIGFYGMLYSLQSKLIYHPRSYESHGLSEYYKNQKSQFKKQTKLALEQITFSTSSGEQLAWFIPPLDNNANWRLWCFYGGNGQLALDWLETLQAYSRQSKSVNGFLLLDYPGYGFSEGAPSPDTILESGQRAVAMLSEHWQGRSFSNKIGIVGQSLGSAAALQHAAWTNLQGDLKVDRLVLLCPFTSVLDMSKLVVGRLPFIDKFLNHNFDNRVEVKKLSSSKQPVHITIIHGTNDEIVPVEQGRALADYGKELGKGSQNIEVVYKELTGCGHNDITIVGSETLFFAMGENCSESRL